MLKFGANYEKNFFYFEIKKMLKFLANYEKKFFLF